MRQYERTRQNRLADKILASKGYTPGLMRVGMEDCARIHKNRKHDKPSEGSEYACKTVDGFLRKTDASVYERTRQPRFVDILLVTYYSGDIL